MPDILLLILMSLATFRITWFVTRDSFPPMRWIRERIIRLHWTHARLVRVREMDGEEYADHRGRWTWLADLITCYWCISVWVAAGVTLGTSATIGLRLPLLWWIAVASLAAIIATYVDAKTNGSEE